MTIDRKELRRVMGHFATGVTVITTCDADGKPYGLTANALCSLSLDPPLVLICVDKKAETHPIFECAGAFAVNVLGASQEELSRRFAVSGGEKFGGVACRTGRTGVPLLAESLAHVECRLVGRHEGGDHTVYIGEVDDGGASEGDPLLFFRGRYRSLQAE
jgi:flavin reductase (DIM6/NTAB) family NADH-FMN oxidoreductase RutF